jgi:serine/threonine protein kinase
MLAFNPDARWSAKQLLEHPYLASLHDPSDEPESGTPLDICR